MTLTHLIFDLDDTLYPPGNGLWAELGERINLYMIQRVGVDPAQVHELRRQYYQEYGTTLRGLMTHHPDLDPDDFLAYVHAVDSSRYLTADPALDAMLAALPQPKAIFTNSDAAHANRILNRLGVARHFPVMVDIRAMNFENKPRPLAYQALLRAINAPAAECLLIEDSPRNLHPAKALGMATMLISQNGHAPDSAIDYHITAILQAGPIIQSIAGAHEFPQARGS